MIDSKLRALEVKGLRKEYRRLWGRRPPVLAVQDVSFYVPRGMVFGLLGPNGAGKTTTIKMICGLVRPDAGQILINGSDVQHQRGQAMSQLGAVLEGTRNVYWRMSAWQNLMYFGRLKGRRGPRLRAHAERLLRDLELYDLRHTPIHSFSRGMQQKVAIACALVAEPSLVLLDEPTLGLDVSASRTVKQWIERISRQEGVTVVLTTHQLDLAQEMCDRVAIVHRGRVIANKTVPDLLRLFAREHYRIRLGGVPDGQLPQLAHNDFQISQDNGETVIQGMVQDQRELFATLQTLHGAGLPLLSVQREEPNLEEVFVRLTAEDQGEELLEGERA